MKTYINVILLLIISTLALNAQNNASQKRINTELARKQYIKQFYRIAIDEQERIGIPASIKLAQGILETDAGRSSLATKANNHFGVKCGAWKQETYYHKDDDYDSNGNLIKSCFRKYKEAAQSYRDHSDFLKDEDKAFRYGDLFLLDPLDHEGWAQELQTAGYASNPNYAKILISLINRYELYQYDMMSKADLSKYGTDILKHNRLRMVYAQHLDNPKDIAERYNYSLKKLLKYNELKEEDSFDTGYKLYLQKKRKKYKKQKTHEVKEGETMHDIAQSYGIRLNRLYRKNRMEEGREPATNTKVNLKRRAKRTPELLPKGTIPQKPKIQKPVVKPKNPAHQSNEPIIHIVERGDNLTKIAKRYKVTVQRLKKWNNLTSDVIRLKQELIVGYN